MPTELESVEIVDKWLYATLSGDATLSGLVAGRISGTLSNTRLATPYVHYSFQSERSITTVDGEIITADCRYLIKAVAQTASWDPLIPIVVRLSQLVHRPREVFTVAGAGSLSIVRESIVQQPEVDEGIQYRHLGGIYRIRASADD